MKNLLLLTTIMTTILLTACGSIEFDAVEVEGFIVNQVNEIEIKSYEFTEQGELVENSFDVVPTEVLEYLEIDAPEVPELETEFTLTLVDSDEVEFDFETVTNTDGQFDSIEFVEAGTFTFEIAQIVELEDTNWTIANAIEVVVTVTEDTENEVLVAEVSTDEVTFVNVYTVDMSDDVQEVIEVRYAEIVAERERIEAEERAEAERVEAERVAQAQREAAAAQQQTPAPAQSSTPAPAPSVPAQQTPAPQPSTPAPAPQPEPAPAPELDMSGIDESGANCNNGVSGWVWVSWTPTSPAVCMLDWN